MEVIRFFQTAIIVNILFLNTVFSKTGQISNKNFDKSYIIEAIVDEFSKSVNQEIEKYNKKRTKPRELFNDFPTKDKILFLKIIKKHQIKTLPEIIITDKKYLIFIGKNKFEIDLISIFK